MNRLVLALVGGAGLGRRLRHGQHDPGDQGRRHEDQSRDPRRAASAIATPWRIATRRRCLSLAHPNYYEDSGTPSGHDDYGYDGLKDVLSKRLSALKTLRYNIEYRAMQIEGHRAQVDIRYDASFQLATEMGDRWERKMNDKRIELENDGKRWLIIAGM